MNVFLHIIYYLYLNNNNNNNNVFGYIKKLTKFDGSID